MKFLTNDLFKRAAKWASLSDDKEEVIAAYRPPSLKSKKFSTTIINNPIFVAVIIFESLFIILSVLEPFFPGHAK